MGWIQSLIVKLKGDKTHLDATLEGAKGSVNSFGSVVQKIGGWIAVAFGIRAIVTFGKECIELASKAEGIRIAFERLNKPDLLSNLKEATRGTVDEMTLMQKAIQAHNFKIPLDQLAIYFEFATKRAIQTGESVDYLVSSIITGLGRKSVLVMDNLGISAVELQDEIKKTGDFASAAAIIIQRELKAMGDVADTAATKLARIKAETLDLKTAWGEFAANSGVYKGVIDSLSGSLQIVAEKNVTFWQKTLLSLGLYKAYAESITEDMSHVAIIYKTPAIIDPNWKPATTAEGGEPAKGIKDYVKQIREAAIEANKMAAAWKIIHEEIVGAAGAINPVSTGNLLTPKLGTSTDKTTLAGAPKFSDAIIEEATKMEQALTSMRDMAVSYGGEILDALGQALGGDATDLGQNLLRGLANFLSQIGMMLITLGLGIEAFIKSTATLNPVLAIAAGTAMMITAGIIKGALSHASSSVRGGGSGGGGGGGNYSSQGPQTVRVIVAGEISGKTIKLVSRRYDEDNG